MYIKTAMRYSPFEDYFFHFVSDEGLDHRCLFYHILVDSLVLDIESQHAKRKKEFLAIATWDSPSFSLRSLLTMIYLLWFTLVLSLMP